MKANQQIGQNIKYWREFKQIKQEELAKKLNITSAALSHLENGKTEITMSKVEQISQILNVDFYMILQSPQDIITLNKNTNNELNNLHTITINQDLIITLKEELQEKNEHIRFLQSLINTTTNS